jgi:hypothetical protein
LFLIYLVVCSSSLSIFSLPSSGLSSSPVLSIIARLSVPCFFLFVLLSGKSPGSLYFCRLLSSPMFSPWFSFSLDFSSSSLAYCWPFYRAITNDCSPICLFFPRRRISLGGLVFCGDLDARFDPYLSGIVIFMKIVITLSHPTSRRPYKIWLERTDFWHVVLWWGKVWFKESPPSIMVTRNPNWSTKILWYEIGYG